MKLYVLLCAVIIASYALSLLLASRYSPVSIYDNPNSRSLHIQPVPRIGGIAILVAVIIGWGGLNYLGYCLDNLEWILGAVLLIAIVSFTDDLVNLSPVFRIIVHGFCAGITIYGGGLISNGFFCILSTWLAIVWVVNLYNFMDGMDGFATGMAVFGFGFLGATGWLEGFSAYAFYSWIVALASMGFLLVNFPPARIFLGDIGSVPLGLLAACFSIWGVSDNIFPMWYPLLVFSPFVVDATITLLRRLYKREKIWQAHRSHYYQRLVLAGWSHKQTVLFEYMLMAASGVSALVAIEYTWLPVLVLIMLWVAVYVSIHFLVVFQERKYKEGI